MFGSFPISTETSGPTK